MTATASRLARTSDGDLFVGSPGWSYPSRRPEFYPAGLASEELLSFDAASLGSVELNSPGYRVPSEEQLARWAAAVPGGFRWSWAGVAVAPTPAAEIRPLVAGGTDVFAYFRHEDAPTAPAYAERLAALVRAA
ncbi:MAG: DUF72 domain-containing protein [Gaiellaceae bacterium]